MYNRSSDYLKDKLTDTSLDLNEFREELIAAFKELEILLEEKDKLLREVTNLEHSSKVFTISQLHDGPLQDLNSKLILFRSQIVNCRSTSEFKYYTNLFATEIGDSIQQIREILKNSISAPTATSKDLATTLRELIRKRANDTGIKLILDQDFNKKLTHMPQQISDLIIHFVQETIRNAYKHGQATECEVSITCENSRMILVTCDNGNGFNCKIPTTKDEFQSLADSGALGLSMLFEMAAPFSGNLSLKSKGTILGGAEIRLVLPIQTRKQ